MKLILLRHGQTEANERRLYCGASDLPLSDAGRAELARLRARVRYPSIEGLHCVTSGMRRADETLRLLFNCEPERREAGFREMNFGRFELHSYDELKDDADYQRWIMDESGRTPASGGESSAEFDLRVRATAATLREDTLLVCHGGVIAALMRLFFPEERRSLYQWQPDFGRGYQLRLDADVRDFEEIKI